MLRSLTLSLALLAYTSSAALADPCAQILLKPDQSSTTLQGRTTGSDTDSTCFQLAAGVGRHLHLSLIHPANPGLAFTIIDVVDDRNDYSFVTARDAYKILVFGTFRATPSLPFQISVTSTPGVKPSELGDPADTVSVVVKLDSPRSSLFAFNEIPTAMMRKYFTADFIAIWVAAMRHNKTEPVLDGDPLTGLQGVKSVTLKGNQSNLITADNATVTSRVVAQPDGSTFTKPQKLNLRFHMKRENGVWKITDISNPSQASLHTYLSRFK